MTYYTKKMNAIASATGCDNMLYGFENTLATARQILVTKLQRDSAPNWLKRREYVQWWLDNTTSPYVITEDEKGRVQVEKRDSVLTYNTRIYRRREVA